MRQIKNWIEKETLDPGILSLIINPYYFIKKGLIKGFRQGSTYIKGRTLDFGCGKRSYHSMFRTDSMIGLEVMQSGHLHDTELIDVFYDGQCVPFRGASFDSIICIEVFEHVFQPTAILTELNRVLKPGGHLLMTIPFAWEEHEVPYDYSRYTSFGISHLLESHGFRILNLNKSSNFVETVFQLWNLYLYKKLIKHKILAVLLIPFLIFPTNLCGLLLSKILPQNHDLYLNTVIIAQKSEPGPK
jgi:SAM-dependent methyltransferase